jgi:hypothetical protein
MSIRTSETHVDAPSPLAGEGSDVDRRKLTRMRGLSPRSQLALELAEPIPHPALRATFSRKGRREVECAARPESYRTTLAASSSRSLALAVASSVPSSAISFASTNAIVLPSCVTLASPMIGPGFAGARKFTVMLMVVV